MVCGGGGGWDAVKREIEGEALCQKEGDHRVQKKKNQFRDPFGVGVGLFGGGVGGWVGGLTFFFFFFVPNTPPPPTPTPQISIRRLGGGRTSV